MHIVTLQNWLDQAPRKERLYLVGGTVRDLLLHSIPKDLDLVCRDAAEFAHGLARRRNAAVVLMEKRPHRPCYRLVSREDYADVLDISEMQGGTIYDDLGLRDFTINAIAMEVGNDGSLGSIIDPFHGSEDAEKGVIRATKEDVFRSDPLRVLRALRFFAELDFTIEPLTSGEMGRCVSLLERVSAERIIAELLRILKTPRAAATFRRMDAIGVIEIVFPEIKPMKGSVYEGLKGMDPWEHSLLSMEYCELITNNPGAYFGPWTGEIALNLERDNRLPFLKLSALLHEIGKSVQGVDRLDAVAKRLKMSNLDRRYMVLLSGEQAVIRGLVDRNLQKAEVIRWFRRMGEEGVAALILGMAAAMGAAEDEQVSGDMNRYVMHLEGLVRDYYGVFRKRFEKKNFVSGRDLIGLGMAAGPGLGQIIEIVRDLQDSGEITTREEATEVARKLVSKGFG